MRCPLVEPCEGIVVLMTGFFLAVRWVQTDVISAVTDGRILGFFEQVDSLPVRLMVEQTVPSSYLCSQILYCHWHAITKTAKQLPGRVKLELSIPGVKLPRESWRRTAPFRFGEGHLAGISTPTSSIDMARHFLHPPCCIPELGNCLYPYC